MPFDAEFEFYLVQVGVWGSLLFAQFVWRNTDIGLFELFDNDLYDAVNLENCVKRRISEGGTSVQSVEKQIEYVRNQIK